MFSFKIGRAACAALIALCAVACEDSPFDPSTSGSSEGDRCDMSAQGACGSGLECYVPPNCSFAVCCPPQDPSNPVCYCAGDDGGDDGGGDGAADAGGDANSGTLSSASVDARASD